MRNLFRLVAYLRFHRRQLVLAYVALAGSLTFTALTPWMLKYAIDEGIGARDQTALIIAAVAIVAFSLGKGCFAYLQFYLGESISQYPGHR